ncbi:unnamed protein product, partial [Closterium sp. Yama58-4]
THRRRTTYEGTRESSREAAGGLAWDGGRGGRAARAGAVGGVGEGRAAWEEEFEREVLGRGGRGGRGAGQGDDALMQAGGDDGGLWGGGVGRRSSGGMVGMVGMVGMEGDAGEEGRGRGEGQGRGRRKQRGGSGMQKQFLREAGRLAEYLDCRIEEASRPGAAGAGPRTEQGGECEGSGGAVDDAHADDQGALAHAHDLPPKVHLWQHHESLSSRNLSNSLSSLHRYFDYRCQGG